MIVIGVILKGLLTMWALVYGCHAAELGEAAAADVLFDPQHEEVVGTGLKAQVVRFPGISALRTLDTRLKAV